MAAIVAPTAQQYAGLMTREGPRGDAWPTDPSSVMQQAYTAFGGTWANLNGRENNLLVDSFPATAVELLPQWEASLGLPDACTPLGATVTQRQLAVVAKLVGRGGRNAAYFVAVAAAMGFAITITGFAAFVADQALADDYDNDDGWTFTWQVNVATQVVDLSFTADASYADEPLDVYETGSLECRLRAVAPASKTLIFAYGGVSIEP